MGLNGVEENSDSSERRQNKKVVIRKETIRTGHFSTQLHVKSMNDWLLWL